MAGTLERMQSRNPSRGSITSRRLLDDLSVGNQKRGYFGAKRQPPQSQLNYYASLI